jgi:hypothetical protein
VVKVPRKAPAPYAICSWESSGRRGPASAPALIPSRTPLCRWLGALHISGALQLYVRARTAPDHFAEKSRVSGPFVAGVTQFAGTSFPGPDFEIFVMNADGSNRTQITFNKRDDEDPAWSGGSA